MPEIKKDCYICHLPSVPGAEGSGARLKLPLSELCLSCHPDRVSPAEHVVDVEPSSAIKVSGLPLYDGRLTCATCHEPHGLAGQTAMLRVPPSELCGRCHVM